MKLISFLPTFFIHASLALGMAFSGSVAMAQDSQSLRPSARIEIAQVEFPMSQPLEAPTVTESEKPVTRNGGQKSKKVASSPAPGGYFVEFRARTALSYGHTFVVHGRLNSRGRIISSDVAGLHPAGDDVAPWMIGHFIPVKAETGASDGDTEDQYIAARYRINLNAEQYARVSGFIRNMQANSPMWHAVLYNCSAFVADIGRFMGLQSPSSLEFPADFINGMRRMNGGRSTMSDQQALAPATLDPGR